MPFANATMAVSTVSSNLCNSQSFARRARIYDIYYAVCIEKLNITAGEEQILQYAQMPLADDDKHDDSIIYKMFGSGVNAKRVKRDESKISILDRMNKQEAQEYILEKNLSVIQEYKHDIELWKF